MIDACLSCMNSSLLIRTNLYLYLMVSCVSMCTFIVHVLFLSLSLALALALPFCMKENLSRKQTSPIVDGSSTIVCSRVFIFMRHTPQNGKFERKKRKRTRRRRRKSTLLEASERTGRWQQRVFRYSFCVRI